MSAIAKRELEWLTNIRQNNSEDKIVTRDKEGHAILMKGPIHLQDTAIINTHLPENTATEIHEIKLAELEQEIKSSTIIVRDLSTSMDGRR